MGRKGEGGREGGKGRGRDRGNCSKKLKYKSPAKER